VQSNIKARVDFVPEGRKEKEKEEEKRAVMMCWCDDK
jgi:hypothetical protein